MKSGDVPIRDHRHARRVEISFEDRLAGIFQQAGFDNDVVGSVGEIDAHGWHGATMGEGRKLSNPELHEPRFEVLNE